MSEEREMNATIESTSLGRERGCMTCWLFLDYGDHGSQGAGGYALDEWNKEKKQREGAAIGMSLISEILRVLGVDRWEKLPGTPIRARAARDKVSAIGHYLKDDWLVFADHFTSVL